MNIDVDIDSTSDKRKNYYPFLLDQLDALWHDIDDGKLGDRCKNRHLVCGIKSCKG